MPFDLIREKSVGSVNLVTIGATAEEGGTRTSVVTVGGENSLPFMHFEGETPYTPAIALEVIDKAPSDWPDVLAEHYSDVWDDPAKWAKKCVDEYGADMICLRLLNTHPDEGDTSPDQAAKVVKAVLEAVGVPLIIWGCDQHEKDNEVMPVVSQAASGERCLLGSAVEDNYKTLVVSCLADDHNIITESPLDINIGKQVNILASDMGMTFDRMVIYQTNGALGYGLEYAYSIMERMRLAALQGDKTLSTPMICMVGSEAWRVKEAKATVEEQPQWGSEKQRGPLWEAATAFGYLQSGADILVMRHPEAVENVRKTIQELVSS